MADDYGLDPEQVESLKRLLKDPRTATRLIRIADEDEKREWMFAMIRKTAAWVAGVLAALILFWDTIVRVVRGIGS